MYLRIAPDVPKIDGSYWYLCDSDIKGYENITVGTIVRINLHGRRVRGWVLEVANQEADLRDHKESNFEIARIKRIVERVSDGPPPHLVKFAESLSRYYLVSPIAFLRSSSPTRIVNGLKYLKHEPQNNFRPTRFIVDPRADRRELIRENIAEVGSTLIVAPDGHDRISQWLASENFNVINFSSETKNEVERYRSAAKNSCVVVGGRASLFAPVTDCQAIIVLDDAYEQLTEERSPRWRALDVAKLAAKEWGAKLSTISSIPTSSTFEFEEVDCRVNKSPWPKVYVENRNESDPLLGAFTPKITTAINASLDSSLSVAVILNNTVTARLLVCKKCDTIATCELCQHAVIQDDSLDLPFVCPVCRHERPSICLSCNGTTFKKFRRGLKSVAEECRGLFAKRNVLEVSKTNISEIKLELSNPNLYIATESIFHKPELTESLGCVIFLDMDSIAFRPSMEAFQQALVILNRALRSIKKSSLKFPIVISTRAPENQLIADMKNLDFKSNLNRDLQLRKNLKLAPYFATAEIKAKSAAIDKYVNEIPQKIISGKSTQESDTTVYLSAPSHEELSALAYKATRSLTSNNRCIISIDIYG